MIRYIVVNNNQKAIKGLNTRLPISLELDVYCKCVLDILLDLTLGVRRRDLPSELLGYNYVVSCAIYADRWRLQARDQLHLMWKCPIQQNIEVA